MSELLIGLVGILFLVAGLQQIARVSGKSFTAYVNVRADLAEQLADPMSDYSGEYRFIETVTPGTDQKRYTGDDQIIEGDDEFFTQGNGFLERADYYTLSDSLSEYAEDPYSRLDEASYATLSEAFTMHYAYDRQSVELVPLLRKALGRETIELEREAWMPSWRNLLEVVP